MTDPTHVQQLLGLSKPPIAISFLSEPPAGVPQWKGDVPAGCVFWLKAQQGQTFYTVSADHYNCAVGSYTHHISLPPERARELEETIGCMVENNYLALSEVPGIPTLPHTPNVIVYGPADSGQFIPDLVLVAATPAQAMIVYEAALKAGAGNALTSTLGRPACAVLPLTSNSGGAAISLGCQGNRTFTGLPNGELYVCIPGGKWNAVADKLAEALAANSAMASVYLNKKEQIASA